MDISKNIKLIRDRKGLSQTSVADLLQMERTNYHRLEKRGNKMSIEQLQSIADALEVSLIEVITVGKPFQPNELNFRLGSDESDKKVEMRLDALLDSFTMLHKFINDLCNSIETAATLDLVLYAVSERIITKEDCKGWFTFDVSMANGFTRPIEIDYESIEENGFDEDGPFLSRVMSKKQMLESFKGLSYWHLDSLHVVWTAGKLTDKILESAILEFYESAALYRGNVRIG